MGEVMHILVGEL